MSALRPPDRSKEASRYQHHGRNLLSASLTSQVVKDQQVEREGGGEGESDHFPSPIHGDSPWVFVCRINALYATPHFNPTRQIVCPLSPESGNGCGIFLRLSLEMKKASGGVSP